MVRFAEVVVNKPPPRIRKPHAKARSGCNNCKCRRIKCDEDTPICGACRKKDLDCIRVMHAPPEKRSSANRVNDAPGIASEGGLSDSQINVNHLRLMHHFTKYTIPSLSPDILLWEECLAIAFQKPFVMHAILMLAAAHITTRDPEDDEIRAEQLKHLAHASEGVRQELSIGLKDRNIDAFFAASILIYTQAWSSPEPRADAIPAASDSKNVDFLLPLGITLRQAITFEIFALEHMAKSPIFARTAMYSPKAQLMKLVEHTSLLKELYEEFRREFECHWPSPASDTVMKIYMGECERLFPVLAVLRLAQRGEDVTQLDSVIDRYLYTWPMLLSPELLDMMQREEPCTKLLFWHFYTTVRGSPTYRHWWASKRTAMMLEILSGDLNGVGIYPVSSIGDPSEVAQNHKH